MEDIRNVGASITDEADKARERAVNLADNALEKGRGAWSELKNRSDQALGEAKRRGSEAWEDAEDLIRKYPAKAVGLALLVGVVVGAVALIRND